MAPVRSGRMARCGRTLRAAAGASLSLLIAVQPVAAQAPSQRPAPDWLNRSLKVGERLSLNEAGGWLELQVLDEGRVGTHTLLEIGEAHVVLEDLVGVSRRWIPLSSIRSVIRTRLLPAGSPAVPGPAARP